MAPSEAPLAAIAPERQALLTRLAQQAAQWWRTQLEGPGGTIGPSHYNNGDTSPNGEMMSLMMSMTVLKQPDPAAETFVRFEELLAADILAYLLRDASPARPTELFVGTDYGPDTRLGKAAQAASISPERFPWKTRMWVNWGESPEDCYVTVRKGYGAAEVRLPAIGEERGQD